VAFTLKKELRPYKGLQGGECLDHVLAMNPGTVLDIGSGDGKHAAIMRTAGIRVTTISMIEPADYVGDFMEYDGPPVDCVWACHVLEHVPNVGAFLAKCREMVNEGGTLAVTVPPLKTALVGGHINLFTMGTLIYNLILAGFKVERIGSYGYNLSAICSVDPEPLPALEFDSADLDTLANRFPGGVFQGCDGSLEDHQWD
tara:strand:+ start:22247 stop:22846 length:600 start_codon:yes stop_codon:yes gene_type:complete